MIIKNKYFNHRWAIIGGFTLPQLLFLITYEFINPLTACAVMAVAALVSAFCMYTREVCGFITHILAKVVMAICAALAYYQGEPSYFMVWLTIYGLLAVILSMSSSTAKRMSMGQYTSDAVVMSDKGARAFQRMHCIGFFGLAVIAEIARRNMAMDSWIYFQFIVPSLYYWIGMLWLMLSIQTEVIVNGERMDHYIVRYLTTKRKR